MYTKTDLLDHLDNLIRYAIDIAGYEVELVQPLAELLRGAIEDYCEIAQDIEEEAVEAFMLTPVYEFADSFEAITDSKTGELIGYDSDILYSFVDAFDIEAETIKAERRNV